MPVTGITQRRKFTSDITKEIAEIRLERGVTAALMTGQAFASLLTPVDTSFLINSQFREIKVDKEKRVVGTVGYTAHYASAVHGMSGKLKGQPRGHFGKTKDGKEFGGGTGNGNYWDPQAEPGFLTKGFEDNRQQIDEAMMRAMRL